MPNGNDMSQDLTFEKQIESFTSEGKFLARQLFDVCSKIEKHENRLMYLESENRTAFGLTGGISAVFGGAIIGVINYFIQK